MPWQIDLVDPPGGGDAGTPIGSVSVPLGAHEPRPILIALHGYSDQPGWACGAWRAVANAYPFVVCPRGGGPKDSLAWSTPADTKQRIARIASAVKAMFGDWILETRTTVIVGFSMGAVQATLLAQGDPKQYERVGLSEASFEPDLALGFGRPWARGGGRRALFSCTTRGCPGAYRLAAEHVAASHARARLNDAGTSAHGMWDVVVRSLRRDWPWLVEGAEGWDGYAPPVEDAPLPGKTERFGD